jgi:hypothetical protein
MSAKLESIILYRLNHCLDVDTVIHLYFFLINIKVYRGLGQFVRSLLMTPDCFHDITETLIRKKYRCITVSTSRQWFNLYSIILSSFADIKLFNYFVFGVVFRQHFCSFLIMTPTYRTLYRVHLAMVEK